MNSRTGTLTTLRTAGGIATVTLALCLLTGCDSQADRATCGPYYTHLLQLEASHGHPAILAALRTGSGKDAVMQHCMGLRKSQVKCALQARSKRDVLTCESASGADLRDYVKKYVPGR